LIQKAVLEKSLGQNGVQIETVGTSRSYAQERYPTSSLREKVGRVCIVLPEGILSECIFLFEFALKCAQQMSDTTFIWRLHPSMCFEKICREKPEFSKVSPNISISSNTLSEDIVGSHWALYRGSSSIIQAVVAGVYPVYVSKPGEITIDPLYKLGGLRAEVSDAKSFEQLANRKNNSDTKMLRIQDYCAKLFTPIKSGVLERSIQGRLIWNAIT
jgi:hypothetical protein